MSLKKKTIGGLFWTVLQQGSVQLINFVVQIILARILLPEDFGLIAMLAIFISLGNTLTDAGLTSSLIRTPNATQRDYSTVFFVNLIGSVLIYFIVFASAPLIADFYNQEVLINIVRIYTLSFIIRAFMAIQVTKLTKEMNFKRQLVIQVPSVIGGGGLGIVLAYGGYGVWSLVWMNLFQTLLATIAYWIKTGWYPKFVIDKERLKYHLSFGYKLTLVSIINVLYQNLYIIFIGRFYSATSLGFYKQADALRMFPVRKLNQALDKVTYPMFSSIQENNSRLKRVYKKVMRQVIFWVTPMMVALCLVAEPLFRIVLTEKWLPAVPYFQILSIAAILYPLTIYNLNILKVKGRSDLLLKVSLIKYAIIIVGLICVIPYGILAIVWFQAGATLLAFIINTIYSGKMIDYSIKEQIVDISGILTLGLIVGGGFWWINGFMTTFSDWVKIFIIGGGYFVIYLIICWLFRITALKEFKGILKNLR